MSQSVTNLGKMWEVALSLSGIGPELAKCQCCSRRTSKKNGGGDENAARSADQRKQSKGDSKQPKKGEDRIEMKKEVRALRCTLLSGSAWSTEKSM